MQNEEVFSTAIPEREAPQIEEASSEFVINFAFVLGLLADEQFYIQVPEFYFMKLGGLKAAEFYEKKQRGEECQTCNPDTVIQNALLAFARNLVGLLTDCGPSGVQNLVKYITLKLGYRPNPIVFNHRPDVDPSTPAVRMEF